MRVLLADDHTLVRAGVASLLEASGFEVVGQAGDGAEALELARRLKPDLVLMDIVMPGCNGLEATRLLKEELEDVKVVILTVSDDDADLFDALKNGADGYLLKDVSEYDFAGALAQVAAGERALSTRIAAKILDEFLRRSTEPTPEAQASELTEREREVLELVAEGATNREIGARLFISDHTVSFHVRNILAKLHLRNRAEAAAYAARAGLTPPLGSPGRDT